MHNTHTLTHSHRQFCAITTDLNWLHLSHYIKSATAKAGMGARAGAGVEQLMSAVKPWTGTGTHTHRVTDTESGRSLEDGWVQNQTMHTKSKRAALATTPSFAFWLKFQQNKYSRDVWKRSRASTVSGDLLRYQIDTQLCSLFPEKRNNYRWLYNVCVEYVYVLYTMSYN